MKGMDWRRASRVGGLDKFYLEIKMSWLGVEPVGMETSLPA